MAIMTAFLEGGKIEGDEAFVQECLRQLQMPFSVWKTCRRCGSYYQDRRVELVDAGKSNLGCCGNHGSM